MVYNCIRNWTKINWIKKKDAEHYLAQAPFEMHVINLTWQIICTKIALKCILVSLKNKQD